MSSEVEPRAVVTCVGLSAPVEARLREHLTDRYVVRSVAWDAVDDVDETDLVAVVSAWPGADLERFRRTASRALRVLVVEEGHEDAMPPMIDAGDADVFLPTDWAPITLLSVLSAARRRLSLGVGERVETLRAVIEAVPMGILVTSPDQLVLSNRLARDFLGVSAGESMSQQTLLERVRVDAGGGELLPYGHDRLPGRQALEGRSVYQDDVVVLRDGEAVPVEVWGRPGRDSRGEIRLGVVAFQDASARRQAERDLKRSRRTLEALLDAMPVAVFVVDRAGFPFYANPLARDVLERATSDGSKAASLEELASGADLMIAGSNVPYPAERLPGMAALRGEASHVDDAEIEIDGVRRPLEVWGAPVRDEDGEILYAVSAFVDITERRAAEARVRTLNDELEGHVAERTAELGAAYERLKKTERHARLLKEVAEAANAAASVEEAVGEALKSVGEALGWPVAHAYFPTEVDGSTRWTSSGVWYLADPEGFAVFQAATARTEFEMNEGAIGTVAATLAPRWMEDVADDPSYEDRGADEVHGGFVFPVVVDGESAAVVEFYDAEPRALEWGLLGLTEDIGLQLGHVIERKRVEAALAASERRFRSFFDHAPFPAAVVTPQGSIVEANEAAQRLYRLEAASMVGLSVGDIVVPEDQPRMTETLELLATGEADQLQVEQRHVTVDGRVIWVVVAASAIRDGGDRARHVVLMVEDTTERKLAEDALRESEHRFRAVFDQAVQVMAVMDREGRILEMNASGVRFLGRRASDAIGMTVWASPLWDGAEGLRETVRDAATLAAAGDSFSSEAVIEDATGARRAVEWTIAPIFGHQGRITQLVLAAVDVTERRRALADMRKRVREVDCLLAVSSSVHERTAPEHVLRDTVEIIPWSWRYPDVTRARIRLDDKVFVSDSFQESPWRQAATITVDGVERGVIEVFCLEERPEAYEGPFLKEERDLIDGLARLVSQMIKRNEAEEGLRRAREEAEAASRSKSAFLASMSHEIRTPMNAILGFAQLLQREALTPSQKRKLETIQRSGDHLLLLIDDVLEMSKIEAGRMSHDPGPFDPHALLDELGSMFSLRSSERGLTLEIERADDLPRALVADSRKLRQILINLVGNAVKFTHEGGIVVRAWMETSGDELLLVAEVSDTGIGIDGADLERVFEPFERTEAGEREPGTGLGLPICKRYVELMEGTIAAHSEVGVGSTFRITVPVRQAAETTDRFDGAGRPRKLVLAPGMPAPRALVIDDNIDNRALMSALLQDAGFEVHTAHDGRSGLERFERLRPELALVDLRMPDMSGHAVMRAIREWEARSGHRAGLVAVSASAFQHNQDRARAAGADEFVRKPFRESQLWDAVAHATGLELRTASPSATRMKVAGPAPRGDALATVTQALRERVEEATLGGDYDALLAAIDAIEETAGAAAVAGLRESAERFDYDGVLAAIRDGGAEPGDDVDA